MKNQTSFLVKNFVPLFLIIFWSIVIFLFCSCSTAKVYKQESIKTRTLVIQPCIECDQDGGIYIYSIMSTRQLPQPPSIQSIPGAIKITKNGKYSYLLAVNPLHEQTKVLKSVSKLIYK